MKLTAENFCQYVKDASTNLKLAYVCKRTGEICPKVDYRTGKALPSTNFIKNGCQINKQIIEDNKKEVKKEATQKEETVKKKVEKEKTSEVKTTEKKEVAKKTPVRKNTQRKRTNTTRKKTNNNK